MNTERMEMDAVNDGFADIVEVALEQVRTGVAEVAAMAKPIVDNFNGVPYVSSVQHSVTIEWTEWKA
jgi:hypothetical protein